MPTANAHPPSPLRVNAAHSQECGRQRQQPDSARSEMHMRGAGEAASPHQSNRRFPAVNRHFRHHTDATMLPLPFALAAVLVSGGLWSVIAALAVRGMRGLR